MSQLQELVDDPADPRGGQRMTGPARLALWLLLCAVLACCSVGLMLLYARRRGMLDMPGQRRSHRQPTPRGGGIGMMLVLLVMLPWIGLGALQTLATGLALAAVALIGAWDDLVPRGIGARLAVHLLAVAVASIVALALEQRSMGWLLLVVPLGVWSVNLHNFMDGIDGLLATHCVVVAAVLGVLAQRAGLPALACLAGMLAAVSAGFLCFNWAPARIFMGDAGSGGIGLLVFVMALTVVCRQPQAIWAVAAICSSFVVDASMTLLSRMVRGRRWTQPHREHLYQWLVRCGHSHARVSLGYLAWDGLVGLWILMKLRHHAVSPLDCLLIYGLASAIWLGYKFHCLRHRRPREFS
ncbi:glycosyltransferase family 4 protein [Frateuria aurantia]